MTFCVLCLPFYFSLLPRIIEGILRIRLKKGWKVTLHQGEIKKQLGIPKTSFYRAIENLSKEGLINWEAPNGLVVELADHYGLDRGEEASLLSSSQQEELIESHEWDNSPTNGTESPTNGTESPTNGTETPSKLSPNKDSSDSSNYYQIFINSLSKSEREKFFNFVKEEIKDFKPQIKDLEAWLASKNQAEQNRWEVYYNNFLASLKKQSEDSQKRAIDKKYQQAWKAWQEELKQRSALSEEEEAQPQTSSSQPTPRKTTTGTYGETPPFGILADKVASPVLSFKRGENHK
jgi:hypothetical protein